MERPRAWWGIRRDREGEDERRARLSRSFILLDGRQDLACGGAEVSRRDVGGTTMQLLRQDSAGLQQDDRAEQRTNLRPVHRGVSEDPGRSSAVGRMRTWGAAALGESHVI